MDNMLSQAEIDALLGGGSSSESEEDQHTLDSSNFVNNDVQNLISSENKDILGEIGNISMGTSATTLNHILNQKVWITTPKVNVVTWKDLASGYSRPCVGIRINYKEGLKGSNVLILKQRDVKIIADLMMGGSGDVGEEFELTEIDLSAIGEAMNQMVGSSSTSLSSMTHMKIDIDTPKPFILDFKDDQNFFDNVGFQKDDVIAVTSFKMEIGQLIDSQIMQILPIEFANDMIDKLKTEFFGDGMAPAVEQKAEPPKPQPQPAPQQYTSSPSLPSATPDVIPNLFGDMTSNQNLQSFTDPQPQYQQPQYQQQQYQQPQYQQPQYQQPQYQQPQYQQPQYQQPQYQQPQYQQPQYQQPPYQQQYQQPQYQQPAPQPNINVQPAVFESFDVNEVVRQKENINIIMDVPLEVTVELGRTRKKIKDILEFNPGTIIELDKIAGEPIDILVNGKYVAKGEVVVIDENFGIRVTDIVSTDKRI